MRTRFPISVFGPLAVLAAAACANDVVGGDEPPVPASVSIQPGTAALSVGDTLRLRASALDARGAAIAGATVAWSSSDPSVASVDNAGLVTGRGPGEATVMASAGPASATATLAVSFRDFAPARDTTLSGAVRFASLTIPDGVAVTAQGALQLHAAGEVRIAGTLRGDCVAIDILGEAAVTVSGTITNACSGPPPIDPPRLRIVGAGAMAMTGTVTAAGDVLITNDTTLRALSASAAAASAAAEASAGVARAADCNYVGHVTRGPGRDGDAGTPEGTRGYDGGTLELGCSGEMTLGGELRAGRGGDGGTGRSANDEPALGASGAAGGDIVINAAGGLLTAGTPILRVGRGGDGGFAEARSQRLAQAVGGPGGDAGLPRIVVRSHFSGSLVVLLERAGHGGRAEALGIDGLNATASAPADSGGSADARGGPAGDVGSAPQKNLFGDLIVLPSGANRADVRVTEPTEARGGTAYVVAGSGGDGNASFPDGAAAGNLVARGGQGGNVYVVDDRADRAVAPPGPGGFAVFGMLASDFGTGRSHFSDGGRGADRCNLPIGSGGRGGRGSDVAGSDGQAGTAHGRTAAASGVVLEDVGNGGDGEDGDPAGSGGNAGSRVGLLPFGGISEEDSFEPGNPGRECVKTVNLTTTVTHDPANHENVLRLRQLSAISVQLQAGDRARFTGSSPWVTGTAAIGADRKFGYTTFATVAGRPNTSFELAGQMTVDATGRVTGFDATLTIGANGTLPQGQAVTYRIVGTVP